MTTRAALAFTLAVALGGAQADEFTDRSLADIEKRRSELGPYPQPQEYGTRTEVYLDNGRVTRITEHLSSDEDDETYIYGDTYDEFDELDDEDW